MRDGVSPVWTTSVSTGGASSASRDRIAMASTMPDGAQMYLAERSMKLRMLAERPGAPMTSCTGFSFRFDGVTRSAQTTPVTSRGPSDTVTKLPGPASRVSGSS